MADGKIAIDLDKIAEKYSKKNNGNDGKKEEYDLDTLYNYDARQTLLERMQKRGQLSMMDLFLLNKMERDERRDMMSQQQTNKPVDVEEIIRKSQEPLLKQIEEMKLERERERQEAKFERLQQEISGIKDLLANGNGKKSENEELLKRFDALNQQLSDEKEKARQKEQERFQKTFMDQLDSVNDAIEGLRHQPQSKGVLEQLRELNALKKDLMETLGIKEGGKEEEAGIGDLVDTFAEKGPKIAKSISTMRDAFRGDDKLEDDIPLDSVPTNIPERARPRENRSVVPNDITEFLNQGQDTADGYKDITGVVWKNKITGTPIHRADIEDLAITDPDQVRDVMKQAYQEIEEAKARRANPQPRQETFSPPLEQEHDDIPEPEPPKEAAPEPAPQEATSDKDAALKEAMDYINSGNDQADESGTIQWVGKQNETYASEQGLLTKEKLIEEAKKDPVEFMKDVRAHLATLKEE